MAINSAAELTVSHAGLGSVASGLLSAAAGLSALASAPLAHPPLAADEVSTSAAARLTEHGTVMGTRAADAASVLQSAAAAIAQAGATFTELDVQNAATVSLRGGSAPSTPAFQPAITTNAVAGAVPITPMAARPGEVTAGLIEAGNTSTGTPFVNTCNAYGTAFNSCAAAVRTAQAAVTESVTGATGPRLSAALNRFAGWADDMARHANVLAETASTHHRHFQQTQHQTPRTQKFTTARANFARSAAAGSVGAMMHFKQELLDLDNQATAAGVSYHLAELPQAPPPPPPVEPVVQPQGAPSSGDGGQPTDAEGTDAGKDDTAGVGTDTPTGAEAVDGDGALAGVGGDVLADDAAQAGIGEDPLAGAAAPGGDPVQQIAPLAGMMAGALGSAVGAAASVPQQLGQQVQGAATQAMQGMSGLASGLAQPDIEGALDEDLGLSDLGGAPSGLGGLGSGGGGGGGGADPASGEPPLPPAQSGMLGSASAPPTQSALTGAAVPPRTAAAPMGMGGGMPMMMPMMGAAGAAAAGGAGSRQVAPADKKVEVPQGTNAAPVEGDNRLHRHTATVDEAKPGGGDKPVVRVNRDSKRRIMHETSSPDE